MTAPTKDNLGAVPVAPREAKGATVGEASSATAAAPTIRGYAPPIIDTVPPASSAPASSSEQVPPFKLPRLWLAFHSDGKALYCTGTIQRAGLGLERVRFDPSDPIVAQAYAFFVKQMVTMLGTAAPPLEPAPEPEPPAEPEAAPAASSAPDLPPPLDHLEHLPNRDDPAPPPPAESVPLAEVKTKREPLLRRGAAQKLEPPDASDDSVPPTNPTNPRAKE